jgi:hypothetical protein
MLRGHTIRAPGAGAQGTRRCAAAAVLEPIQVRAAVDSAHESRVGSHYQPIQSHAQRPWEFDNDVLPRILRRLATLADNRKLHGMEGVRGSNPLSSTKKSQVRATVWIMVVCRWEPSCSFRYG